MRKRILVFLALVGFAACTKHNPNACCVTNEQCSALGLDGPTSCKPALVCDPNGACVMPQCSTSADCTSPDAPVCIGQLCVAKCSTDDDCNGLAGTPHCGTDGVCVACVDATQCTADAPVCDADARACRGCTTDGECAGGVCLDSTGMCAAGANVVYVRADGSDAGACTSAAPCLTLPYAFGKLTGTRNVVHIMGTAFSVGTGTVDLPVQQLLFLDGEDTMVRRDDQGAVFTSSSAFVSTTFSRVTVGTPASGDESLAISAGTVVFSHAGIVAPLAITGGSVEVADSTMTGSFSLTSACSMNGTLNIHDAALHGALTVTDCTVTLARNMIDSLPRVLSLAGAGVKIVENNTITSTDYFTDAMGVTGDAGSSVRFNTFVNFSGVDMGAQTLDCGNANVDVTSNIFAWHSHTPLAGCTLKYNLFDEILGLQPGTGNHVGDAATFFVDLANKDLHLASTSPAIGIGETGLPVTTDLEGKPRPQPDGSSPDVGAYEAP